VPFAKEVSFLHIFFSSLHTFKLASSTQIFLWIVMHCTKMNIQCRRLYDEPLECLYRGDSIWVRFLMISIMMSSCTMVFTSSLLRSFVCHLDTCTSWQTFPWSVKSLDLSFQHFTVKIVFCCFWFELPNAYQPPL